MKIGDKLTLSPTVGGKDNLRFYPCTVVYIHPAMRFFRVKFVFEFGGFTECFGFDEVAIGATGKGSK